MTFNGFDEDDYEFMRQPGSKMQLTEMNGHRHICHVVSFDESTQCVTVKYERNTFMSPELLNRLRDDEFEIDLREYQHEWIDPDDGLYCLACHSMELDHLFVCKHASHGKKRVAFHDRCLDANLGHIIPNNDCARTWTCPIHMNLMQKIDPSTLRKRRGDYDFAFDRPQKKRKIVVNDPNWLKLPEGVDPVYPIHDCCQYCYTEGIESECDGYRPCGNCAQYVQDEIMDLSQPKYISMNEQELQHEIDLEADKYCHNRDCTFEEFMNDDAIKQWLEMHNNEKYHLYQQEKREKEQQRMDLSDDDDQDIDLKQDIEEELRKKGIKEREKEDLVMVQFPFKQPEFVDNVPIYARYQCSKCNELFPDKYRYKMHVLWSHDKVIACKAAFADEAQWKILNHFKSDKPLKYACPYAGCLRGANNSEEINDHILRHHDITDPTKPKEESSKSSRKKGQKKKMVKKMVNMNQDDVKVTGVPFLDNRDKGKISKIWHESTSQQIDRKNRQHLIKNFVAAIIDDNLDRFDETTRRLQREFKQNMERLANIKHHGSNTNIRMPDLPPPLTHEPPLEHIDDNAGPRSLWG